MRENALTGNPSPVKNTRDEFKELNDMQKQRQTSIVSEAMSIVRSDRERTYGEPTKNFDTTARMLEAWINSWRERVQGGKVVVRTVDIPPIMCLLKLARIGNSIKHKDSWIDLIGYSACMEQCVKKEGGWDGD